MKQPDRRSTHCQWCSGPLQSEGAGPWYCPHCDRPHDDKTCGTCRYNLADPRAVFEKNGPRK